MRLIPGIDDQKWMSKYFRSNVPNAEAVKMNQNMLSRAKNKRIWSSSFIIEQEQCKLILDSFFPITSCGQYFLSILKHEMLKSTPDIKGRFLMGMDNYYSEKEIISSFNTDFSFVYSKIKFSSTTSKRLSFLNSFIEQYITF